MNGRTPDSARVGEHLVATQSRRRYRRRRLFKYMRSVNCQWTGLHVSSRSCATQSSAARVSLAPVALRGGRNDELPARGGLSVRRPLSSEIARARLASVHTK